MYLESLTKSPPEAQGLLLGSTRSFVCLLRIASPPLEKLLTHTAGRIIPDYNFVFFCEFSQKTHAARFSLNLCLCLESLFTPAVALLYLVSSSPISCSKE